jgi:hypothetical protein
MLDGERELIKRILRNHWESPEKLITKAADNAYFSRGIRCPRCASLYVASIYSDDFRAGGDNFLLYMMEVPYGSTGKYSQMT